MKNLLLYLALLCLSGLAQSETKDKPIRIATGEYIPFCSSSSKHKGFASHVVSEAFARQGYKVEYNFLPWKRAILQAKNNDYDATSWWVYTDERAEDFLFSDKLLETATYFFYLKTQTPNFNWAEFDDLTGYRIGITRGYHYSDEFQAYRKAGKASFEVVNEDEQNFKRLLYKRIDLFPVNVVVGLELLRARFAPHVMPQVAFHPNPVTSKSGFLMFPKKGGRSEELQANFNAGLKSIREDGSYEKMLNNLLTGFYSQQNHHSKSCY